MSSLTLGFTFVMAGIGAAIAGRVAEVTSLTAMFAWLPLLPLISCLFAVGLGVVYRARLRGGAAKAAAS